MRDAALRRISHTRRWIIVGAAALSAGLAALVSALLPGKSLGAKSPTAVATTTRSAGGGSTPQLPPPASAAQLGVGAAGEGAQPIAPPQSTPQADPQPQAAPQPAPAPSGGGAAVSGGS